MSTAIQLALAVGEPADGPAVVSLAEAGAIAAVAGQVGVASIRLVDRAAAGPALDPTVVAAYLAGRHDRVGYVADVPTTNNAPYNVARRVLSLDRATGGRVGIALRTGAGDEVSDATAPQPGANDPAGRWTEYADVLLRLWESFPRAALIGDQAAGIVLDAALIAPIDHEGAFYRVTGPLDGPASVQGRPVLVADLGALDITTVARSADVVVVDREAAAGVDAALDAALWRAGRSRVDVALLGRAEVVAGARTSAPALARELRGWADEHRLDGLELVIGGNAGEVVAALRALVPLLTDAVPAGPTLRAAFGLRAAVGVPA